MVSLRQAAINQLRARVIRRHGRDSLPISINRRRIYILPTRFGFMLGAILAAMLIAGLNYNSNLALAFAFLMSSMALVTMHHCNRNMLRLSVDVTTEVDAFAGREAMLEFELRNGSSVDRRDIEVRCMSGAGMGSVAAGESATIEVIAPVTQRGVTRISQFELRTRYPFGWFYSWTYVQGSITVYVAPAPIGSRALPSGSAQGAGSHSEARGDEDFSGLRAYEPGVPLEAHGVEGTGARRRSRRCAVTRAWPRNRNGWTGPCSKVWTPRRACRSSVSGCWKAMRHSGPTGCGFPARSWRPPAVRRIDSPVCERWPLSVIGEA